jgi:hypothetical protein
VHPFGESEESMDEVIPVEAALDLILSAGHGILVADKTQRANLDKGTSVHDMAGLKTRIILELLEPGWNSDRQILEIDETGLH